MRSVPVLLKTGAVPDSLLAASLQRSTLGKTCKQSRAGEGVFPSQGMHTGYAVCKALGVLVNKQNLLKLIGNSVIVKNH